LGQFDAEHLARQEHIGDQPAEFGPIRGDHTSVKFMLISLSRANPPSCELFTFGLAGSGYKHREREAFPEPKVARGQLSNASRGTPPGAKNCHGNFPLNRSTPHGARPLAEPKVAVGNFPMNRGAPLAEPEILPVATSAESRINSSRGPKLAAGNFPLSRGALSRSPKLTGVNFPLRAPAQSRQHGWALPPSGSFGGWLKIF